MKEKCNSIKLIGMLLGLLIFLISITNSSAESINEELKNTKWAWQPIGIYFIKGQVSNVDYVHSYTPYWKFHIDIALTIGFPIPFWIIINRNTVIRTSYFEGTLEEGFICGIVRGP